MYSKVSCGKTEHESIVEMIGIVLSVFNVNLLTVLLCSGLVILFRSLTFPFCVFTLRELDQHNERGHRGHV